MNNKVVVFFSAACFLLASNAAAEEVNTGDISREAARQAAGDTEERKAENIEIEERDIDTPEDESDVNETFELKGVIIDSDIKDITQSKVQHIIDPYINQQVGINQLRKLAAEIKMYCRQKGWLAAVAYLPEQDSTDGTIIIRIMSPNFGKITFENESHLADDILNKVASNISQDDIVENDKIENVLYLLNEIGGIRARGALIPDSLTKRIDLHINVVDDQRRRGISYRENYGSKSSGRYRWGLIYDIYNIDNRGSRLELSGLLSSKKTFFGQITDNNLDNYLIDYSWITDRKTTSRLGISFGRTTYHQHGLGSAVIAEAGGHSTDLRIYGTTPVWKTIHDGFTWNYGYKFRRVTNSVNYDFSSYGIWAELFPELFPTYNNNVSHVHTFSIGFSGYKRSLSNDLFNYSFTLFAGNNSPRTDTARELAELNGSNGRFFRSQLVLDYRKLFNKYFEFHTNINIQNASRGLNSSEQLQLGGANGVRGYADGDGAGDEGYLSKTELIWHTKVPGLSFNTFFDIGGVGYKQDHDIHTIRSWGIGVNYTKPNEYFVRLDYARKIGNNLQIASDDKKQRIWFMIGTIF